MTAPPPEEENGEQHLVSIETGSASILAEAGFQLVAVVQGGIPDRRIHHERELARRKRLGLVGRELEFQVLGREGAPP